jgi:hypothetical protein
VTRTLTLQALPPEKETRYPLYRRLGGPPVWTGAENLAPPPPPGFDPLTVQAVASRYTDYDIPAPGHDSIPSKLLPNHGIFFAWVENKITNHTFP